MNLKDIRNLLPEGVTVERAGAFYLISRPAREGHESHNGREWRATHAKHTTADTITNTVLPLLGF